MSANHAKESGHELKLNPDKCRGHGQRLLLKACPALLSQSVPSSALEGKVANHDSGPSSQPREQ